MNPSKSLPFLLVLLVASWLAGCAGDRAHRQGMNLLADGKAEEGLAKLEEAVRADPDDLRFRMDLQAQRGLIVGRMLTAAAKERAAGRSEEAEQFYRRVLVMEPESERATSGLEVIARDRRHRPLLEKAGELAATGDAEGALAILRPIEGENPSSP
jgi:general secretion pathway protein D